MSEEASRSYPKGEIPYWIQDFQPFFLISYLTWGRSYTLLPFLLNPTTNQTGQPCHFPTFLTGCKTLAIRQTSTWIICG